ncbi:hypothetical protein GCG21_14295 [Pseudactinotalea sp. HY160]|uniref:hypothetical protein n=1 Tax=Pseudactinotalea sp. HY160 TaxID=2654490 RepID=UPI00128CC76B|nr:hypothetical protein [Pseudactinotalea sp. HY160]MPV51152.1 hypothetical protein [Pseudactinotalea sp. HY160]
MQSGSFLSCEYEIDLLSVDFDGRYLADRMTGGEFDNLTEEVKVSRAGSVLESRSTMRNPSGGGLMPRSAANVDRCSYAPLRTWLWRSPSQIIGESVDEHGTRVAVELPDGTIAAVRPHTWEITRPMIENGRLCHETVGTYTHADHPAGQARSRASHHGSERGTAHRPPGAWRTSPQ